MAGEPFCRDPRDRGGLPQGVHSALASGRHRKRVRIDLSVSAKFAARGAGRRSWSNIDYSAFMEPLPGSSRTWATLERSTLRRRAAGLADGALRVDDAAASRGG